MESRKKLELSRETLRGLTSDVPGEGLVNVRGGGASANTCVTCVECVTTIVAPTLIDTDCWATR